MFLAQPGLLAQFIDGAISEELIAERVDTILGLLVRQGFTALAADAAYEVVTSCGLGTAVTSIREHESARAGRSVPAIYTELIARRPDEYPHLRQLIADAAERGREPFHDRIVTVLQGVAVSQGLDWQPIEGLVDEAAGSLPPAPRSRAAPAPGAHRVADPAGPRGERAAGASSSTSRNRSSCLPPSSVDHRTRLRCRARPLDHAAPRSELALDRDLPAVRRVVPHLAAPPVVDPAPADPGEQLCLDNLQRRVGHGGRSPVVGPEVRRGEGPSMMASSRSSSSHAQQVPDGSTSAVGANRWPPRRLVRHMWTSGRPDAARAGRCRATRSTGHGCRERTAARRWPPVVPAPASPGRRSGRRGRNELVDRGLQLGDGDDGGATFVGGEARPGAAVHDDERLAPSGAPEVGHDRLQPHLLPLGQCGHGPQGGVGAGVLRPRQRQLDQQEARRGRRRAHRVEGELAGLRDAAQVHRIGIVLMGPGVAHVRGGWSVHVVSPRGRAPLSGSPVCRSGRPATARCRHAGRRPGPSRSGRP